MTLKPHADTKHREARPMYISKHVPGVEDDSDFDDEFLNSIGMQAGQ